jgi:hypothetical protein
VGRGAAQAGLGAADRLDLAAGRVFQCVQAEAAGTVQDDDGLDGVGGQGDIHRGFRTGTRTGTGTGDLGQVLARGDLLVAGGAGEAQVAGQGPVVQRQGDHVLAQRGLDDPDQGVPGRSGQLVVHDLQPQAGGRTHAGHGVGVAAVHGEPGGQDGRGRALGAGRPHGHRVLARRDLLVGRDRAVADVVQDLPGVGVAEVVQVDVDGGRVG